jgi:hypothetical protein
VALGLAACGGGSQSAQTLLSDTFHSRGQINSGKLDLAFALSTDERQGLQTPVSLRLSGPFESKGVDRLPDFAFQLLITAGGRSLQAGAVSANKRFFLSLAGASFEAPQSTLAALRSGYAQAAKSAGGRGSALASLGVDPSAWLAHPVKAGTARIGDQQTVHLSASLNLPSFLQGAEKLSNAGGATGLAAGSQLARLLSPRQRTALESSLKSAHIDVYTGAEDHLLRALSIRLLLVTSAHAEKVLGGLRRAQLSLRLQFSELNKAQRILPPAHAQPMSQLLSALGQLGLSAQGSSSGPLSQAPASGSTAGSAPASSAYMTCAQRAGQDVSALQRCARLLR